MDIVFSLLLFLHVVVCLLLVLLILMQRPKQEGLGAAFASGMMSESFGAQTTDVLQKGTRVLGIAFFVLVTLMAMIQAQSHQQMRDASGSLPEAAPMEEMGMPVLPEGAEMPVLPEGLTIPPSDPAPAGEGEETAPGAAVPAEEAPGAAAPAEEAPGTEAPAVGAGEPAPEGGEAAPVRP